MKTLIVALCLAATPAAAQVIFEMPSGEQPDRNDRDRDQERARRHEDRRDEFRDEDRRDRDHSDDDPDALMVRYNPKLCFERGEGESKGYLAAHCVKKPWHEYDSDLGGDLHFPITCTFNNGNPEVGCSKLKDGCLVCAVME